MEGGASVADPARQGAYTFVDKSAQGFGANIPTAQAVYFDKPIMGSTFYTQSTPTSASNSYNAAKIK